MDLYPITLSVAGSGNAQSLSKDKNPELVQKVLERDDHTCRFCGFTSMKYQLAHAYRPESNGKIRPVTACIFCHQCFHLDEVSDMRSGVLVWLPELDQASLHHLARAIYVARISQGPIADAARSSLDILMKRRDVARNRLGTDDPYILSTVLKDYITGRTYKKRRAKLEGIRLFPLDRRIIKEADLEFNQFPQILAYWRSKNGPFGGRVPNKWVDLYKDLHNRAA